ncbi:MAG: DEAD/DEAH box helicase [Lentimicrobium sp.]|nr:DEAD/DEAH box helicase [Lentimicrobium sp.]
MIKRWIQNIGIDQLNTMQEKTLEELNPGKSLILIAPTGSGKTLAFLIPLIKMINPQEEGVQAVILTPTRELTIQIEEVFRKMSTGLKVNACYGGHPVKTEINNFRQPAQVIIGTPGRMADHINRKSFEISNVKFLILDEFDKSLELGFNNEMKFICENLTGINSRVLTSATKPNELPAYLGTSDFVTLNYSVKAFNNNLSLAIVKAEGDDKLEALFRLICSFNTEPALIFCNHREAVERISSLLWVKGIVHGVYHGGLDQDERELSLIRFRNGTHQTLLTTDLGSRGLDIPEIKHVVHYQLPGSETIWIHRNGRTARMHSDGTAWLIFGQNEYLPDFIKDQPEIRILDACLKLPVLPPWETLYLGAGKKQKINKGDIVGYLIQRGGLEVKDIGRIDVLDHASFVAINRQHYKWLIPKLKGIPLKKKIVKIDLAG